MNCVYIFYSFTSPIGSLTQLRAQRLSHILLGSCEVLNWFYMYMAYNNDMINTRYYNCRSQKKPLTSLESALLLCLLPSAPLKNLPSWVIVLV